MHFFPARTDRLQIARARSPGTTVCKLLRNRAREQPSASCYNQAVRQPRLNARSVYKTGRALAFSCPALFGAAWPFQLWLYAAWHLALYRRMNASLELRASEHGPIGRLPASAGLFSHTLPHETFAPTGTVLLATANLQIDLPLALSVRNDTTHTPP